MLAALARVFLCVTATQTKTERLNSTSGHIVEDRRSKLLTQHVTQLTFLHENLEICTVYYKLRISLKITFKRLVISP
jgi:hAT family C-terminal dimerisation region